MFPLVSALVLEVGGQLSHGAIVAREYGIPAVLNVADATRLIRDGQTITVLPKEGACLRCVFVAPPPPGLVPSCSEAGILGGMAGIVGTIQAVEALKYLLGMKDLLTGRLLIVDAQAMHFRDVEVRRNPDCPVCGEHPTITDLVDYEQKACGIKR